VRQGDYLLKIAHEFDYGAGTSGTTPRTKHYSSVQPSEQG
jgi:hypothetical protein